MMMNGANLLKNKYLFTSLKNVSSFDSLVEMDIEKIHRHSYYFFRKLFDSLLYSPCITLRFEFSPESVYCKWKRIR